MSITFSLFVLFIKSYFCFLVVLLLARDDGVDFLGVICSFTDTGLLSNLFVKIYSPHILKHHFLIILILTLIHLIILKQTYSSLVIFYILIDYISVYPQTTY